MNSKALVFMIFLNIHSASALVFVKFGDERPLSGCTLKEQSRTYVNKQQLEIGLGA